MKALLESGSITRSDIRQAMGELQVEARVLRTQAALNRGERVGAKSDKLIRKEGARPPVIIAETLRRDPQLRETYRNATPVERAKIRRQIRQQAQQQIGQLAADQPIEATPTE
jgi:hypothetical protein